MSGDLSVEEDNTNQLTPDESSEQPAVDGEKSASFTVYRKDPIFFAIRYVANDDTELYRKFEEKIRELRLPRDKVFGEDKFGDRLLIRNVYDMSYLATKNSSIPLYVIDTDRDVNDDEASAEQHQRATKSSERSEGREFISFILRRRYSPRFEITYKDKDDLFRQFVDKLKALNLDKEELFFVCDNKVVPITNANALHSTTQYTNVVTLHNKEGAANNSCWESEYTPSHPPLWEDKKPSGRRACCARDCLRHRHQKAFAFCQHHHPGYHHPHPQPHHCVCAMDPRLASQQFHAWNFPLNPHHAMGPHFGGGCGGTLLSGHAMCGQRAYPSHGHAFGHHPQNECCPCTPLHPDVGSAYKCG